MALEEGRLDYFGASRPAADAVLVTPADRAAAVDFCYEKVDGHDLDRDTVAMAMNAVDGFLSQPSHLARDALRDLRLYRLVVAAALSLCVEASEGRPLVVPGHDVQEKALGLMTSHLRRALGERVHAPTGLQIARRILSLALRVDLEESRWGLILDLVLFQTEYAVRDYFFSTRSPSILAVAAVLNTFDQITGQDRQTLRRGLLRVLPAFVSNSCPCEDLLVAKERLEHVLEPDDSFVESRPVSPTTILGQLR